MGDPIFKMAGNRSMVTEPGSIDSGWTPNMYLNLHIMLRPPRSANEKKIYVIKMVFSGVQMRETVMLDMGEPIQSSN